MAETSASTAYGVMSQIALEQYQPHRIVDDAYAAQMLPGYAQVLLRLMSPRPLHQAMSSLFESIAPGVLTGILCRKRYVDDQVLAALKAGVQTVVILGAGLDTLAYRLPELASARVYEVDFPQTITYKSERLRAIFGSIPAHVTLTPIDFETQKLETVLTAQGYSFEPPTLFIWEGVTQYLSEAAVRATLQSLTQAAPASRLVFTYVRQSFIDGSDKLRLDSFYKRMRSGSDPLWKFGLDPAAVADFIRSYGWTVVEQAGAAEWRERYVLPAGRSEPITELERIVSAEKAAS